MTYLTELTFDPAHKTARHELTHPALLHQRTMSLLPDGLGHSPRAEAGCLWRLDTNTSTRPPSALLQTATPPDTTVLPDGYLLRPARTKNLEPALRSLSEGQRIRYRIVVNPTRVRTTEDGRKSRVVVPNAELESWWVERLAKLGFAADTATTRFVAEPALALAKPRRFKIARTRIDGAASITGPDAAAEAIRAGIGRSRSWGCGLLTIAPG